jgi:hypothetical protein
LEGPKAALVKLQLTAESRSEIWGEEEFTLELPAGSSLSEHELSIQKPVETWDEFNPVRYRLTAHISTDQGSHQASTLFGFRKIARQGRHLLLNGRRIFLRGVVDCAIFPRTGHPPMGLDQWMTILGRIKDYGFNHVRFHTWCPPEAAFEAADRLGLYLAPETPFWVDNWTVSTSSYPKLIGSDPEVVDYVRKESDRISEAYGNHPSFTFFCIGNEFGNSSHWKLVNELLRDLKKSDPRRLYNATTARKTVEADDFWVTHNTGKARTRGIGPPHTNWDFSKAVRSSPLPLIAHETGQRPVFPDFVQLLPKFTGPLKPLNMERLQRRLQSSGLEPQTGDFTRASARFQYVQYKAEHEAMRRTPAFAGYQLLMLNDFTGQSEALVGILDPFFEEKGVIQREEIRQWNAPSVILARFSRYHWNNDEVFSAVVEISHFGLAPIGGAKVNWSLMANSGLEFARGKLDPIDIPSGGLTQCGQIEVPLEEITQPTALTLRVETNEISNEWPIWVYPFSAVEPLKKEILVLDQFDETLKQALSEGKNVLFLGHGLENKKAARTGFASVYWSAGWWGNQFSSLGLLCDPDHPALALFPNSGHSDWQWHGLTRDATTFLLDDVPKGFKPIVQIVPDFHFSSLLGQLLGARAGNGRILICGYDLSTDLDQRRAARQLRQSLLRYMESEKFRPQNNLSMEQLRHLLTDKQELESKQ